MTFTEKNVGRDPQARQELMELGLLPGTMRERLLRRASAVRERIITRDDLSRAEAVVLCNALRGVIRATPVCMPRAHQSTAAAVHGN